MMRHRIRITGFLSLFFVMAVFLLPAWAAARWSAGLGFEFASGKYGTDVTTDSVYMPLTATVYPTARLDVSLEIPYVYQSSSAANVGIFRGSQGQTMGMQDLGADAGSGMMTSPTAGGAHNTQSGLGDVVASAGYVLIPESKLMPQIRPSIFVKFPTADKALGTGEIDEGFAVALSKWLGDWYSFAEAGYTIQGASATLPLKDYLSYRVGTGYQVTDKLHPMLMLKGATSPAESTTDLLEARLRLIYQASKRTVIEGYLARGLATSSPDYGAGLAIFYDF
ncbi:MAG: transporter [Syntrophales bacterium]